MIHTGTIGKQLTFISILKAFENKLIIFFKIVDKCGYNKYVEEIN